MPRGVKATPEDAPVEESPVVETVRVRMLTNLYFGCRMEDVPIPDAGEEIDLPVPAAEALCAPLGETVHAEIVGDVPAAPVEPVPDPDPAV